MPDKKLTDKEIIKALECCFMEQQCNNCPLYKEHSVDCLDTVLENAHALITHQQAENENLKVENQSLRSAANSLKMHYEEAQAEIERLKKYDEERDIRLHAKLTATAKSEAIKEFANKLKELDGYDNHIFDDCVSLLVSEEYKKGRYEKTNEILSTIDNLVKEMVGENNDL